MYKGSVWLAAPMVYALGFLGLFVVGGLTGLYLGSLATDVMLTGTYFIVAHFHYVMVGGTLLAYLAALHFWWPKMTGRMYPETIAKWNALLVFIGFNVTFFPQFVVGFLGMPRRYHYYYLNPEFQFWHVLSTAGATVLGISLVIPGLYLTWSWFKGPIASANPWGAKGLEWEYAASPPISHNFLTTPVVDEEVYNYDPEADAAEYARIMEARDKVGPGDLK
jgi:cytochrome c oxidase subunit 1